MYLKAPVIVSAILLGACAVDATHAPLSATSPTRLQATPVDNSHDQALLLVSLDDGTVIKQTIDSDADICFKVNSEALTTCLTEGAPVIDPNSDTVIGYEMIEARIDLVARSD